VKKLASPSYWIFVGLWVGVSAWFWYRVFAAPRASPLDLDAFAPEDAAQPVPSEPEVALALETECRGHDPRSPPKPALRNEPVYPLGARIRGVEGWAVLEFVVGVDGTIDGVEVLQSEPAGEFERVARDAVASWQYCPVHQPTSRKVRLDFKLDGPDGTRRSAPKSAVP
jgi:protein TonB